MNRGHRNRGRQIERFDSILEHWRSLSPEEQQAIVEEVAAPYLEEIELNKRNYRRRFFLFLVHQVDGFYFCLKKLISPLGYLSTYIWDYIDDITWKGKDS